MIIRKRNVQNESLVWMKSWHVFRSRKHEAGPVWSRSISESVQTRPDRRLLVELILLITTVPPREQV